MSVIAHHLIWTNYGTWLGNDPRGSGSRRIYTPALASLDELHYGRRRTQPKRQMVQEFYKNAELLLQFPIIRFRPDQFAEIADTFAETIRNRRYTCYACAILPVHVHLVVRKHRDRAEEMIENFQADSRRCLQSNHMVPVD